MLIADPQLNRQGACLPCEVASTSHSLRPIKTADELRSVMELAWARPPGGFDPVVMSWGVGRASRRLNSRLTCP